MNEKRNYMQEEVNEVNFLEKIDFWEEFLKKMRRR